MSSDLIAGYLAELRAKLRTPDADLVLAEAEDHLRESAEAGRAVGMTEREAQEAAISAFGSVRAVTRAHRSRYGRAAAGMAGLVLLGANRMTRRLRRAGAIAAGYFPFVATAVFGAATVGISVLGRYGIVTGPSGITPLVLAVGYAIQTGRTLCHQRRPGVRPGVRSGGEIDSGGEDQLWSRP
jgi:hypothetical protein